MTLARNVVRQEANKDWHCKELPFGSSKVSISSSSQPKPAKSFPRPWIKIPCKHLSIYPTSFHVISWRVLWHPQWRLLRGEKALRTKSILFFSGESKRLLGDTKGAWRKRWRWESMLMLMMKRAKVNDYVICSNGEFSHVYLQGRFWQAFPVAMKLSQAASPAIPIACLLPIHALHSHAQRSWV